MSTYRQFSPRLQEQTCIIQYAVTREECAEIPVCSMAEYSELLDRNEAYTVNEQRNLYCSAYLLGYMTADAFWKTLRASDLVKPQEAFLKAYATGVLALAAESENVDPEPPVPSSDAMQPPPPDIVRVTYEARQRRNGRDAA